MKDQENLIVITGGAGGIGQSCTPLQRNGQPEDIADVVYFLSSDAARFITGTDILVDGGVIQNIKKMG